MESSLESLAVLGQLLNEYRPRLLAMLRHRIDPALARRVDAEEFLNDVYLMARNRWPKVAASLLEKRDGMTPFAWLYRLTRDALFEAWDKNSRGKRDLRCECPLPQASSMLLGMGLLHPGTSPSEAVVRAEMREQVRQAVDALKPTDRELLWMRHQDSLSYQEIASVLQITENAAMVRYTRALRRFGALWERLHPESRQ